MFYLDIPGGLAILIVVVFLIYASIKKILDIVKRSRQWKKDRRSQKVFDLYLKLQRLSPEDRDNFLKNQPQRIKERYRYAVSLWGEPD